MFGCWIFLADVCARQNVEWEELGEGEGEGVGCREEAETGMSLNITSVRWFVANRNCVPRLMEIYCWLRYSVLEM